jgi:hypothetical protein
MTLSILPVIAAVCILISLTEAWILSFMRYLKIASLKRLFPGYHYLVRSHIDYLLMGMLLFLFYLILDSLQIQLGEFWLWMMVVGAIYNPFGFLVQAIKPDAAESDNPFMKAAIMLAFLPATLGFGGSSVFIILSYI